MSEGDDTLNYKYMIHKNFVIHFGNYALLPIPF